VAIALPNSVDMSESTASDSVFGFGKIDVSSWAFRNTCPVDLSRTIDERALQVRCLIWSWRPLQTRLFDGNVLTA
jgi:hypothetical protein